MYHPSSFQTILKQIKHIPALAPFSSIEGFLHRYGSRGHPFLCRTVAMAIWGPSLIDMIVSQQLSTQTLILVNWSLNLDDKVRQADQAKDN